MPPRKKGKKRTSGESKDEGEPHFDSTDLLSPSEVVKMRKKTHPPQPVEGPKEQSKEKEHTKTKGKAGKNQQKSGKKDKDKSEGDKKKEKHKQKNDGKEPEAKKFKGAKEKRKGMSKKRSQSEDSDSSNLKSVMYPCGICTKEVVDTDEAIMCEAGCEFWYHRKCAGMTDIAYHLLTKEDYAEWVCDKCIATKTVPLVKIKNVLEASVLEI